MSFLISLFASIFPQYMGPFNSLFCRWRRLSQSLCDIAAIRSISILLIAVITAQVIGSVCEGSLSDSACHDVGTSGLTIRVLMLFYLLFQRHPVAVTQTGQAVYLLDQQNITVVTVHQ